MTDILVTEAVYKRPSEVLDRIVPFRGELVREWRANTDYLVGEFVRPTRGNGYDYECTSPGRTAAREPSPWRTTPGQTNTDGSLVWTCRAPVPTSADALTGNAVVTPPTGITATHVSTEFTGDVALRISGGTAGQDYDVLVQVGTVAGQVLQCVVLVKVRA